MQISPRLLRDRADDLTREKFPQSARDHARHDRILTVATQMIADYGRHVVTFAGLAMALRMAPATLRRHFVDIDAIIGQILQTHLLTLARTLGDIDADQPNRAARRRAAYITATRGFFAGTSNAHLILLRDRDTLPPDLREPIELTQTTIGQSLAPAFANAELARKILGLLDNPHLSADDIERAIAAITPAAETAQAQPNPTPKPNHAALCPPTINLKTNQITPYQGTRGPIKPGHIKTGQTAPTRTGPWLPEPEPDGEILSVSALVKKMAQVDRQFRTLRPPP